MRTKKKLDLRKEQLGTDIGVEFIKMNDDTLRIELTHYVVGGDDGLEKTTGVVCLTKEEVATLREFINEKRGERDGKGRN